MIYEDPPLNLMRYVYNDSGLHVEDEYGCLFRLEVLFLLLLLSQSFTTAHEILDFCEHLLLLLWLLLRLQLRCYHYC